MISKITFLSLPFAAFNYPPFSIGEAKPLRGTSRREIGHGNLALLVLKPVIPDDYPNAVRVVSYIQKLKMEIISQRLFERPVKEGARS